MAVARIRNKDWLEDAFLKEEMKRYVGQGLRRKEILDYLTRDFPQYAWSFRSLDRRLREFNIFFTDREVSVDQVKEAVQKEIQGPGQLLGYRAMQNKIRQVHGLNVPRDLVYAVMYDIDAEGLEARCPDKKKCKKKGHFVTEGVNWVHSLDGHDKLMGFQNSTFPLAVYGCLDTASRKLLWLKIWTSNSDPKRIGRWYLDNLFNSRTLPNMIRVDKGTETGTIATMQAYLRQHHGDTDPVNTVIYGPSTSNQVCFINVINPSCIHNLSLSLILHNKAANHMH
jgi:hypothetical protein